MPQQYTEKEILNAHENGDVMTLYNIWCDIRENSKTPHYKSLMYYFAEIKDRYNDVTESREIFNQVLELLKEYHPTYITPLLTGKN